MALIDSSVWIDYFTERPLPHAEILAARLDGGLPVATTGIVMQELLQGLRTEREANQLRAWLSRLRYLPATKATHVIAALLYRKVRARGITLPTVDALIAAVAIENAVPLLTADVAHFEALARVSKLRLLQHRDRQKPALMSPRHSKELRLRSRRRTTSPTARCRAQPR